MIAATLLLLAVATTDTITEREVTIPGPVPLPGVLTLPANGTGPWPAVVIVHGSGPGDRDGTVGAAKPYRDLARGLAGRGIVVLRYDKRTRVQPMWFANRAFTVHEEVVEDAVSAIALLRGQDEVDPRRVHVIGHSLGGHLAPRIAEADGSLASLIVMAGAYRGALVPLMLRQLEYIQSVSEPGDTAAIAAQRRMVEPLAGRVAALTDADSARTTPILGAPPAYWLDLDRYDPVKTLRARREPTLFLQGERDYQVTPALLEEFLAALGDRPGTTVHRFPGLNHLFVAGTGVPRPAEYGLPGHVDEKVIDLIAEWVSR